MLSGDHWGDHGTVLGRGSASYGSWLNRNQDAFVTTTLLLLAEDEASIRDLLEDALTSAGFELTIATNGAEALGEIEEDASRFRAVVTDIKLGNGPDGWEIGRRAREHVADMPVVYMSGDSSHDWASKGVPNSVMIAKPFVTAQVITAVTTLMNEIDSNPAAGS